MIELNNVRKEFDDLVAVQDLNLSIPEREVYGLIGPNGAGKTTTIRIACGLLSATRGSATIAGIDVALEPELAQQHIGYLSDFFSVYEDLTVWEYLDYFARAYFMPPEAISSRIDKVITQVGLEVKRDAMIRGLSRGMKQRLGIARAIIHRPKVLLLDEPASGLDPKARFELRNLLRELRDDGATILISSHILSELEGFCTSIGIMEKGHLIRSGRIEEIAAAGSPARLVRIRWVDTPLESVENALRNDRRVSGIDLSLVAGTFQFSGEDLELAQLVSGLVNAGIRLVSFSETKQTVEDLYMRLSKHEVT